MSNKLASIRDDLDKKQMERITEALNSFGAFLRNLNTILFPRDRLVFLRTIHTILGRAIDSMSTEGIINEE